MYNYHIQRIASNWGTFRNTQLNYPDNMTLLQILSKKIVFIFPFYYLYHYWILISLGGNYSILFLLCYLFVFVCLTWSKITNLCKLPLSVWLGTKVLAVVLAMVVLGLYKLAISVESEPWQSFMLLILYRVQGTAKSIENKSNISYK